MSVPATSPTHAYALVTVARLRPELDGSQGLNRASGRAQIAASTDWDALQLWLRQYRDNHQTFQAYEKEITRFFVWVLATRQKPFSSVVYEDWEAYYQFMADPQPATDWVSTRRVARGEAGYRPFSGPLSDTSRKYAQTVIWTAFEWLRSVGYLSGNPIIVTRRRGGARQVVPVRHLPPMLWQAVVDSVEAYPRETPLQRQRYHYARWLMALFYLTGMRTSEAVDARMGHVHAVRDQTDGRLRHFLSVTGKGGKPRNVPMTDELAEELRQYRLAFGMSAWPQPGEDVPLVFSLQTARRHKPLTRQALYQSLKSIFQQAADDLERISAQGAATLREASTHWLRHTAASEMLSRGASLLTTRDVLGHADISTTSIYSHAEMLQMHRDVSDKHQLNWRRAVAPASDDGGAA